ncbi:DNA sulfur modification protein DndD [Chryseobacterium sp. H3056]|uniref:DNA sulfur modification protein DndD n=1 Tax=Kaistella daneshvariae TaxID=2487074 RepID=A0A3N0WY07_9FLAO|nr:DNA sulfur modification protein DndD [Kaistella daneshvariae]ROI09835.1 DNA sulfur modification protein DndD [Kaistella daneshvariae]
MKFSNIKINNFRQYYGNVEFDLSTDEDRNIILIGGRNGYGKTNFLLSIVWCLYGEKISQVDDNFKKEIQKEKNYSSFMQQSVNWTAEKEQISTFSVSILVDEIELPDIRKLSANSNQVLITRSRNVQSTEEKLTITDPISKIEIFDNDDDKFNFINDYVIPLNAAKFVFFDAEKISEIANLSIKEEGGFINDALGKILGLDSYETLIDDFEFYINSLKREGANRNVQEQIIGNETAVQMSEMEIEQLQEENAKILKDIDDLKKEVRKYDGLISLNSKQGTTNFDRDAIVAEIEKLQSKEYILGEKFNELSEMIPLTILAGKLGEVNNHISSQERNSLARNISAENSERIENFIELLFNKPPEPENSSMSFRDKNFYYEKAKRLGADLFHSDEELEDLVFQHDLNNSEKQLILDALTLVNSQSGDMFQNSIDAFQETNLKKSELVRTLNKIDADLEDDIILEYIAEKETAQYNIEQNYRKIGENQQQIAKLKKDILRISQELVALRNKVEINAQNRVKIAETQKYIDTLQIFLEEQKNRHKESLEKTIINELKILMHKLSSEDNNRKFIEDVKVTILAAGQGMKITLLDQHQNEIRKESLSSGEKQIYISCLIKAILKESIQSLPIFIDTPLGRLDEEHRDNVTKKYYPALSEQVVLFSTNSEITPKRFREISENIAQTYLLVNDGANTNNKIGYYHNENNAK